MFTGNEDQKITLVEGSNLTENYRTNQAESGVNNPTLGHYFSRKTLETILSQPDSVGVRIYYGQSSDGDKELVIVGVEANEDDQTEGFIGDRSYRSPPYSGIANSLNS